MRLEGGACAGCPSTDNPPGDKGWLRAPSPSVAGRTHLADVAKLTRRSDTPGRPCHREPIGLRSVEDSAKKVEGHETSGAKESSGDSRDEDVTNDVTSTLSGLLGGLPALAGPQRLANSLRQKFTTNSGYPRPGLMRPASSTAPPYTIPDVIDISSY